MAFSIKNQLGIKEKPPAERRSIPLPRPPAPKRTVRRHGRRSSVVLENPFWECLCQISDREKVKLDKLVSMIDIPRADNLSSAIRVFVLNYLMERRASKDVKECNNAAGPTDDLSVELVAARLPDRGVKGDTRFSS